MSAIVIPINRRSTPLTGLTPGQKEALEGLLDFAHDPAATVATLKGYAGTGKTFLLARLLETLGDPTDVVLTAPTNKAVHVLQAMAKSTGAKCLTVHKLLGLRPENDYSNGRQVLKQAGRSLFNDQRLIVVDEASMVNRELYRILTEQATRRGAQVLYVGDPAQLPPVFETESIVFKLDAPTWTLTEIVRQARDNPLLALATQLREALQGKPFPEIAEHTLDKPGMEEQGIFCFDEEAWLYRLLATFESDQYQDDPDHCRVLTWTNNKSRFYNQAIRRALYGPMAEKSAFVKGERVVANRPVLGDYGIAIPTDGTATITCVALGRDSEYNLPVYNLVLRTAAEQIQTTVLHESGFERFKVILSELSQAAQGLQKRANEYRNTGQAIPDDLENERRAAWRRFFEAREIFADIRHPHATTLHKSQGSTFNRVFIDLDDVGRNTKWHEIAKLLYVGLTRPRHQAVFAGALPDRLYKSEVRHG